MHNNIRQTHKPSYYNFKNEDQPSLLMVEAKSLTNPQKWKPINQINKLIQKYNQQNKTNLIVHWGRGVVKASMYLLSIQHYSHEKTHLQFQKLPSDPLLQTQQKQKPKKQKSNFRLRSESSPL